MGVTSPRTQGCTALHRDPACCDKSTCAMPVSRAPPPSAGPLLRRHACEGARYYRRQDHSSPVISLYVQKQPVSMCMCMRLLPPSLNQSPLQTGFALVWNAQACLALFLPFIASTDSAQECIHNKLKTRFLRIMTTSSVS